MFSSVKLLGIISVVASASARLVFHESRATPPNGFTSQGAAPAEQVVELRIGLASNNIDGLREKLVSISTPGTAEFRQWLSAGMCPAIHRVIFSTSRNADDIEAFIQPASAALTAFNSFAKANNLTSTTLSPNGEWISISTTVGQANVLFGADFQSFKHQSLSKPLVRTLAVYLPSELVGHIDVIHPTTSFALPNQRLRSSASPPVDRASLKRDVPASCNSTISPACLQDLYGIPATPATQQSNTLLVTAYENEFGEAADISVRLPLISHT